MIGDRITTAGRDGAVQETIVATDGLTITTDAGRSYDLYDEDGQPLGFQVMRPDGSEYLI